jgi:hypothetical protein
VRSCESAGFSQIRQDGSELKGILDHVRQVSPEMIVVLCGEQGIMNVAPKDAVQVRDSTERQCFDHTHGM